MHEEYRNSAENKTPWVPSAPQRSEGLAVVGIYSDYSPFVTLSLVTFKRSSHNCRFTNSVVHWSNRNKSLELQLKNALNALVLNLRKKQTTKSPNQKTPTNQKIPPPPKHQTKPNQTKKTQNPHNWPLIKLNFTIN